MATLDTALEDLREEIETRIMGLAPNRIVKQRCKSFLRHENESKAITEMTGRSRLFYVGPFVKTNTTWQLSYSNDNEIYRVDVTIAYERERTWRSAALDDVNQIQNYIKIHPSTVDGVAKLTADTAQGAVTITEHPTASWDYYTIPLVAYLEVTPT